MTTTEIATTLFQGVRLVTWIGDAAERLYYDSFLANDAALRERLMTVNYQLLASAPFGVLRPFLLESGWLYPGFYQDRDVYFYIREAALAYREAVDRGIANGGKYVDTLFAIPFAATFDTLRDLREGDDPERDEKARRWYHERLWADMVDVDLVLEHTGYQEPEQIEL